MASDLVIAELRRSTGPVPLYPGWRARAADLRDQAVGHRRARRPRQRHRPWVLPTLVTSPTA